MRGAKATPTCPTDTIANARTRMSVVGPLTIAQFEQRVAYEITSADDPTRTQYVYRKISEFVRENIEGDDEIYEVSAYTDPSGGDFWGFSGYVVARNQCVVHVSRMSYMN